MDTWIDLIVVLIFKINKIKIDDINSNLNNFVKD